MRIHFGSGYRVYFTRTGDMVYVLLCGGTKRGQSRDITKLKFRSSLAAMQLGVGWVRRAHLNPSRIASPDERVITQHNGQLNHRRWVTTRIGY